MCKTHKIFSVKLAENDCDSFKMLEEREQARERKIEKLQKQVNKFADKYPDAEVTWLQSSFTNDGYGFTRITAAVTH